MIKRLIFFSMVLVFVMAACRPGSTPLATSTPPTTQAIISPTEVQTFPTPHPSETAFPSTQTPVATLAIPNPSSTSSVTPPAPTSTGQSQPSAQSKAIIVDHTAIELFDQIPEEYLAKARELRMMFADASVGKNIDDSLNCLTAKSWSSSFPACRNDYIDEDWNWKTFSQADFAAGKVPPRIQFSPDPVKYNRSNWVFEALSGPWNQMTDIFINKLAPSYLDSADVLSFQFNYFHVSEQGGITDPGNGYFDDLPNRYDYKDMENFIAEHPDKTFFYWTTSLARLIGTPMSVDFNNQMRDYVLKNNLILFDVADIESHTDQGVPCYDARDNIEYCSRRADGSTIKCENEPDDGLQIPAICQDYTTEPDGGHLGSVSSGGLRLAKGLWVLMARIAGWNP